MSAPLEKVTAFVVRWSPAGYDLLLFDHPNAGVQIPAGTVESDETPAQAVVREAREETGLPSLRIEQYLGAQDTLLPDDRRLIATTTTVYAHPTTTSFDWVRLRRGLKVRLERQSHDFAHVTYEEWDSLTTPTYLSYRITGWVPIQTLAAVERRHFFLLSAPPNHQERWVVHDEPHRFALFWAPVSALPAIISPPDTWLAMLPPIIRAVP
jgi:8-oxo-dGTP pyrophosphatase MutT (NUDIX family)